MKSSNFNALQLSTGKYLGEFYNKDNWYVDVISANGWQVTGVGAKYNERGTVT